MVVLQHQVNHIVLMKPCIINIGRMPWI
jgi:hypothetical protein